MFFESNGQWCLCATNEARDTATGTKASGGIGSTAILYSLPIDHTLPCVTRGVSAMLHVEAQVFEKCLCFGSGSFLPRFLQLDHVTFLFQGCLQRLG